MVHFKLSIELYKTVFRLLAEYSFIPPAGAADRQEDPAADERI